MESPHIPEGPHSIPGYRSNANEMEQKYFVSYNAGGREYDGGICQHRGEGSQHSGDSGHQHSGEGCRHSGEGRRHSGEGRRHSGEGRQQSERGRQHSERRRQHSGEERQHSGEGSQYSGEGRQHSGEGSQYSGEGRQHSGEGRQHSERGRQHSGEGRQDDVRITQHDRTWKLSPHAEQSLRGQSSTSKQDLRLSLRKRHHDEHDPTDIAKKRRKLEYNRSGGRLTKGEEDESYQRHSIRRNRSSSRHNADSRQDRQDARMMCIQPRDRHEPRTGIQPRDGHEIRTGIQPGSCSSSRHQRSRPDIFGYNRLKRMCQDKDDNVLLELAANETSLANTLNQEDIPPDWMTRLLRILAKAFRNDAHPKNAFIVLSVVQDSRFLKEHLPQHVATWGNDVSSSTLLTISENIKCCMTLAQEILHRLPSSSSQVNVILSLISNAIDKAKANGHTIEESVTKQLESLQRKQEDCVANAPGYVSKSKSRLGMSASTAAPPGDFRDVSVFPTLEELKSKDRPFLRPNITRGQYQDIEHYLDVQFRLMREDFVQPLREGIKSYLTNLRSKRYGDNRGKRSDTIRTYYGVEILRPVCGDTGTIYRIQFDCTQLRKVHWVRSKRLIPGSLVCISDDDYESALWATVVGRDPRKLAKGLVDIDFHFDVKERVNKLLEASLNGVKHEFVMIESEAFFEAYRHVLEGMQEIHEESFPFKDHILKMSPAVDPPQYLQENPDATYDLSALLKPESKSSAKGVRILDRSTWPAPGDLMLDTPQLNAVATALTTKFSIIQGPPGTGKTFIGLKIMEILLTNNFVVNKDLEMNRYIDDDDSGSPILVLCYTNHALDQFLEGVLEYDQNIVRVGGRSKSERLLNYNLSKRRNDARMKRDEETISLKRSKGANHRKVRNRREKVDKYLDEYDDSFKGVLNPDLLLSVMKDCHLTMFINGVLPAECILNWLELVEPYSTYQGHVRDQIRGANPYQDDEEARYSDDCNEYNRYEDDRDYDYPERPSKSSKEDSSSSLVFDTDKIGKETDDKYVKQVARCVARLVNDQHAQRLSIRKADGIRNVWNIPITEKWALYRQWVHLFRRKQMQKILELLDTYDIAAKALTEVKDEEDYQILRKASVIGMTTTRAARSRSILHRIKPKIIIVEEAAEILESHITATLSTHCQHLVLIGDHQQLRPSPTVYRLAKDFKLDVSLFERMVNNGYPFDSLVQQHRMRPELSHLMKAIFYPNFADHESVNNMPSIRGMLHNVHFIDHPHKETSADDETRSRSNTHEAQFLVALCRYLLQQDYDSSCITILATYSGQVFQIRNLMDKEKIEGVRVCVVDNYQGEENDIILLSLVRSNTEGSIGFLNISNRVCVALSRARHGFFCIGNITQLSRQSDLWRKIKNELAARNLIGTSLTLACANHPDTKVTASSASDFQQAPEGGCRQPCEFRLKCGHACQKPCHPADPDHKRYQCMKWCLRPICESRHLCRLFCYEECDKVCMVKVEKTIIRCQHKCKVPCFSDPALATCQMKCEMELVCGHRCSSICGKTCEDESCQEEVERDLKCGHKVVMKCSASPDECPSPCFATLTCGHPCSGTCGGCLKGRLHNACTQRCGRILVCGHACEEPCTKNCPPCKRPCENRCKHSTCPKTCGEPCTPCQERCEWRCKHKQCTRRCSEPCDRKVCERSCREILRYKTNRHGLERPCSGGRVHRCRCIGICGEPCPKQCRECDRKEVTEILFGGEDEDNARFVTLVDCGHIIEVKALDTWMEMEMESKMENEEEHQIEKKFQSQVEMKDEYQTEMKDESQMDREDEYQMEMKDESQTEKHFEFQIARKDEAQTENEEEYQMERTEEYQMEREGESQIERKDDSQIEKGDGSQIGRKEERQEERKAEYQMEKEDEYQMTREDGSQMEREDGSQVEMEDESQMTREDRSQMEREDGSQMERESGSQMTREDRSQMEREGESQMTRENKSQMEREDEYPVERKAESQVEKEGKSQMERKGESQFERKDKSQLDKKDEPQVDTLDEPQTEREEEHQMDREDESEMEMKEEGREERNDEYQLERGKESQIERKHYSKMEKEEESQMTREDEYQMEREDESQMEREEEGREERNDEFQLERGKESQIEKKDDSQMEREEKSQMTREDEYQMTREDEYQMTREVEYQLKREYGSRMESGNEYQMKREDGSQMEREDGSQMEREDGSQMEREDGSQMEREDGSQLEREDESLMEREDGSQMEREDESLMEREDGSQMEREDGSQMEREDESLMEREDGSQIGNRTSIQMKACPKCKTTIRRSLRYGHVIKKMLADVEQVKKRMAGNPEQRLKKRIELSNLVKRLIVGNVLEGNARMAAVKKTERAFNVQAIANVNNELTFYAEAQRLYKLTMNLEYTDLTTVLAKYSRSILNRLFNDSNPMRGSPQELSEFKNELERLQWLFKVCKVEASVNSSSAEGQTEACGYLDELKKLLLEDGALTEETIARVKELLEKTSTLCGGLGISEPERIMIVQSMELASGHWFKCPNGHVYAIGECGGATVEARCPECQAVIGGSQHKLRGDNALASEMDGAGYAAYSDQANMDNYDLQDLQD